MKVLMSLLLLVMFSIPSLAGFQGYNGDSDLKIFNKIQCDAGLSCSKVGDKFQLDVTSSGYVQTQVAATATTITSGQCGSSFINSGAVQMELPEASTVLGCRLTFIVGNASNFDFNPDDADQVLVETDAAGDGVRSATLGTSITIEAISASQWAPVATVGTWADID